MVTFAIKPPRKPRATPKVTTKKPRKPKSPPVELLPPGTVLLNCFIAERAVPWKAPTVTRSGVSFKDKRLLAWQDTVKRHAALSGKAWNVPYKGPVEVSVDIRFAKGPMGDATNLLKAIEDSLQGVVFANDRQVGHNSCDRDMGDSDWVAITVKAFERTRSTDHDN